MPENQKESGSFISGFGMGLVTGAAAYFLFATEQGKQLRKRAFEEWDVAQATITKEVGIEIPKDLRQLMKEAVGFFAEGIQEIESLQRSSRSTQRESQPALPAGQVKTKKPIVKQKTTGSKFKGL
jgi:gas vesicle protein